MDPTFRHIVDLFDVPDAKTPIDEELDRPKVGETANESVELGKMNLSDGDYRAALEHFKRAVQQDEGNKADALVGMAAAYEYADEHPQAMRQYMRALKARQDSPEPLVGIAGLYARHGRFRDAVEELDKAIRLDPSNPALNHKLASTLKDMGERTRALAAAQAAVAAKPDDAFFHYWIGDLLTEMGRYGEALESYHAAIELSPGDDYLYLRASIAFWRADRKPEALKAIRLAADLDPSKNLYYGLLEALLEELGRDDDANLESARADKMDRFDHEVLRRTLAEMGIGER